jgi:hypothetical protein
MLVVEVRFLGMCISQRLLFLYKKAELKKIKHMESG